MNEELWYADATMLASLIRSRQISSMEVIEAFLRRIETINPRINALVTLIADGAIASAREADALLMRGGTPGPLHGVPFSIKDSLECAGIKTQRGSQLFAGHTSYQDATAVARLRQAGAIPLFKSNLPEFSMSYETDNRVTGLSRNPWNLERTSGGSSGGESAAIAAGMSPLGLGSDVAISLRGPAAHTGITALKPTRARVPITGHWPEVPSRYWHVGPMARSVRDLALALRLIEGPDGIDPWVVENAPSGHREHSPLRVGWLAEPEFAPVASEIIDAVEAAAGVLQTHGCSVEHVRLPFLDDVSYADPATIVFNGEILPYLKAAAHGRDDLLSTGGRARISADLPSIADLTRAQARVTSLCHSFATFFNTFDVLLCPVVPLTAPPPGLKQYAINGKNVASLHMMDATVPFNLTGMPALCLPYSLDSEGLPIAVQLVANRFKDETVLALGQILERESRISGMHPPLDD